MVQDTKKYIRKPKFYTLSNLSKETNQIKHRNFGFPGKNYFQSRFSRVSIHHFVRNLANIVEEDFCQLNHPEPKPKTHTASQEGEELREPELWERVTCHKNLEIGFEDTGIVCCFY